MMYTIRSNTLKRCLDVKGQHTKSDPPFNKTNSPVPYQLVNKNQIHQTKVKVNDTRLFENYLIHKLKTGLEEHEIIQRDSNYLIINLLKVAAFKIGSIKMTSAGEVWVQWFSCCFHQPQSPARRRGHQRLRIDRSMIGVPTNFQHTGHIGSNDVELSSSHLKSIQNQMQGKGGYDLNTLTRVQAC